MSRNAKRPATQIADFWRDEKLQRLLGSVVGMILALGVLPHYIRFSTQSLLVILVGGFIYGFVSSYIDPHVGPLGCGLLLGLSNGLAIHIINGLEAVPNYVFPSFSDNTFAGIGSYGSGWMLGILSEETLFSQKSRIKTQEFKATEVDSAESDAPRLESWLLLCLLNKEERQYVLGDLEEDYCEIREKSGRRAAVRWYRRQVVRSAGPFVRKNALWGWIRRAEEFFLETVPDFLRRFI